MRRCTIPSGEPPTCAAVGDILTDVLVPFFLRQIAVGNATGARLPGCNINIGIPQADHLVLTGRGQARAVGAEGYAPHRSRVPPEGLAHWLARRGLPQAYCPVGAGRGQ